MKHAVLQLRNRSLSLLRGAPEALERGADPVGEAKVPDWTRSIARGQRLHRDPLQSPVVCRAEAAASHPHLKAGEVAQVARLNGEVVRAAALKHSACCGLQLDLPRLGAALVLDLDVHVCTRAAESSCLP